MDRLREPMDRPRRRLSVGAFPWEATVGIRIEADHLEFIEGEIVNMALIGNKHAFVEHLARGASAACAHLKRFPYFGPLLRFY